MPDERQRSTRVAAQDSMRIGREPDRRRKQDETLDTLGRRAAA